MKGRRSVLREVAILLAAAVVLAAAAFGGQRLLFKRSPVSGELAKNLDASLGSVVRSQVLATHTMIDIPSVSEDFTVIVDRLRDALPGKLYQFERLGYFCVDQDSSTLKKVFNRTVTLRDSWTST